MSEIKHQFTGGKMNKDLDERLVPNGEYRDAMNIQVSTSEGSSVGTVQNILGNSLVPGQDFIGENSICIGSVADEKNDKLYYFITQKEILKSSFENKGLGWTLEAGSDGDINWSFNGNAAKATAGENSYMEYSVPGITEGNTYRITYDVKVGSSSGGSLVLANHTTNASLLNSTSLTDNVFLTGETKVGTHSIDWVQGGSNVGKIRLWNSDDYDGTIDNITVRQLPLDSIVEYDSKENTVTPVFIDAAGSVLKFDPNYLITGVNILDDLLFWTDNRTEPKKINISRSTAGTDASGLIQTMLINEEQHIDLNDNFLVKEEHVTVIRQSPKKPLGLNLNPNENNQTSTAALLCTTDPGASENTSSFLANVTQDDDNVFDFSNVVKDDIINIKLPTDIASESGFTLDWKAGDTLVLKEFTNSLPPTLPLETWAIKATLQDWSGNIFQDSNSALLRNSGFDLNYNNWGTTTVQVGAQFEQTDIQSWGWTHHIEGLSRMSFNTIGGQTNPGHNRNPWAKIWQTPANHTFVEGDSYKLTYDLSGRTGGWPSDLQGSVKGRIVANGNQYDFTYQDTAANSITQTIVLDSTSRNGSSTSSNQNHFLIQTNGSENRNFGEIDNVVLEWIEAPDAQVQIKIDTIITTPPTPTNTSVDALKYAVQKLIEPGHLFKDKLVRFSYRYNYKDGEKSSFAPFSSVAFQPGNFNYHPKKGFNQGMGNNLTELELVGFNSSDLPHDVIEIDILAKVENSPNVYIVDTIKENDNVPAGQTLNAWYLNKYTITTDTIKGAVPSNQLLRPWDNVPKRALAQEVTGNRIVYGNYTQGYDLLSNLGNSYKAEFNVDLEDVNDQVRGKKSIKSLRDYQLGVVFSDAFGRETPVITNQTGSFHVSKGDADKHNVINVNFLEQGYPVDMKYFKFFIKETSSEYYNIPMDRYYVDDDGNAWLSFASSDRNKIDINTTLILKKGVESTKLVDEAATYKVLDVKNEAPIFVKTSKHLIEQKTQSGYNIFSSDLTNAPLEGRDVFLMNYSPFANSSGDNLHEMDNSDLYVEFGSEGANKTSERYRINKISCDTSNDVAAANASYTVRLEKSLGSDVNFITDDITGLSPTEIKDNTTVNIYRHDVLDGHMFEGRFFVKIFGDSAFEANIKEGSLAAQKRYRVLQAKKIYYMGSDHNTRTETYGQTVMGGHGSGITGLTDGAYYTERASIAHEDPSRGVNSNAGQYPEVGGTAIAGWNNFSRFAVFFRNYKYDSDADTIEDVGGTDVNMGQYKFGVSSEDTWKAEFLDYTSSGISTWANAWDDVYVSGVLDYPVPTPTKVADERQEDDEVWFVDSGPFVGSRYTNTTLHWTYTTLPSAVDHHGGGITTYDDHWRMWLGQGGIYHPGGIANTTPNFFGELNAAYQDDDFQGLVEKLVPQRQMRFKEDPTETVYTFQPTTNKYRLIRYAGNRDANKNGAGSNKLQHHEIPSLSPNFTNDWSLSMTPQIAWNFGSGTLGPIENGYNAVVPARASGTTANIGDIDEYYIVVQSNVAVDPIYGSITITKGMLLTAYNNGVATPPHQQLLVREVELRSDSAGYNVYLTGYERLLHSDDRFSPTAAENVTFRQPVMNGYSENSVNRINANSSDFTIAKPGLMAVGYTMEFVEALETEVLMPQNPAVFETEPKNNNNLDVFYEISGLNPITLDESTIGIVLPLGSVVTSDLSPNSYFTGESVSSYLPDNTTIVEHVSGNRVVLSNPIQVGTGDVGWYPPNYTPGVAKNKRLKVIKPNGEQVIVTVQAVGTVDSGSTDEVVFKTSLLAQKSILDWHNCYSFGNGVESNRIKDVYNEQYVGNGVRVSTTLDHEYGEENRESGLIYSGIYNSNSSVNNLNQFIAAEKITKDLNPSYGSIQKLHSRDSDLIVLCEDKVLKILANKDAVYNADGNPQLTANENVLGQTIPFIGEYGISKNPESFASENYRVYFTDKIRGAVLRLSRDGVTPISDAGMKDWFRDNLSLSKTNLLGENNLSDASNWDLKSNSNTVIQNNEATLGGYNDDVNNENYGKSAHLDMDNVLEIGKTYRLQFDIVEYGGLNYEQGGSKTSIFIANHDSNSGFNAGPSMAAFTNDGDHVNVTWTAATERFSLNQYQVNKHKFYYDGLGTKTTTIKQWVEGERTNGLSYPAFQFLYGGTVKIKNLLLEEVKEERKIVGSFDDRQGEYNVTIDQKTVSFKEDVRGWVSFKSFVPENAISCANDYFSMKNGRLWQHHNPGVNRNTFYNSTPTYSSVNVLLNESPGSVKSFHTLDYEGSQSKTNTKEGWAVTSITTNKQRGSVLEFLEKEGKWFGYISGSGSNDALDLDLSAFNVQGIGIVNNISNNIFRFTHDINTSVQVGDTVYSQHSGEIVKSGVVLFIDGFGIGVDGSGTEPTPGDYVLFAKSNLVNQSSLIGYFAEVKLENNSTSKVELFSIGAEVTESSK